VAERDFNAWREPILEHVQELLLNEFSGRHEPKPSAGSPHLAE
jgi:hypothetical protein